MNYFTHHIRNVRFAAIAVGVGVFLWGFFMLPNMAAAQQAWNETDWTSFDTITIDAANIDAALTDFPVYIDLADLSADFWSTTPAGSTTVATDIRVTNASNIELPRELVSASSTAQTGELHFKADLINSTVDTVFKVWYNGTTTGDYATTSTNGAQAVWSDFNVVWHMNELAQSDSAGVMPDRNVVGNFSEPSLDSNGDVVLDGNDAMQVTSADEGSSALLGAYTSWTAMHYWDEDGLTTAGRFGLGVSGFGRFEITTINPAANSADLRSGNNSRVTFSNVVATSGPQMMTVTYEDATNVLSAYSNGALIATTSMTSPVDDWDGWDLYRIRGTHYESRGASTTHSAAEIKATYVNFATSTDFYSVTTGPATWNPTSWTLYDTITINAANIDEDLTDFPVYVDLADLSAQFWSTTPASSGTVGTDIRVTTDDGSPVELPRELVLASSTAQTGELHFKADLISSTTDTAFRIYYNGSAAGDYEVTDTYGAQNVWSDYAVVWHMNELAQSDSAGNLPARNIEGDFTEPSLDSNGNVVLGTDDEFTITSADEGVEALEGTYSSWSAMHYWDGGGTDGRVSVGVEGFNRFRLRSINTTPGTLLVRSGDGAEATIDSGVGASGEHLLHVTYDNGTGLISVYSGGQLQSTTTGNAPSVEWDGWQVYRLTGTNYESRGAQTAFSPGYIRAQYVNFSATTDFYTVTKPWNLTSWTLYDTITINAANIDEDLTDFPVYVDLADLSAQFWSTTPASSGTVGTDIRVTTDDGSPVELPRELVLASSTAQTGELHFKADLISSTTDTAFRIYYNGSAAGDYEVTDTYGAQNVWSDYAAVYHLEDDVDQGLDSIFDSTANTNTGHPEGAMTTSGDLVAGQLGNGLDFDGVNDRLFIPDSPSLDIAGESLTVSTWYEYQPVGINRVLFGKAETTGSHNAPFFSYSLQFIGRDDPAFLMGNETGAGFVRPTVADTLSASVQQYYVGTYDGSDARLYLDGVEIDSLARTGAVRETGAPLYVGANAAGGENVQGVIDEIRISSSTRSDAWIKAEYVNQSTTTDFYTSSVVIPGLRISGTLYENDGVTPITEGVTITAAVVTSTTTLYTTQTDANGNYEISGIATSTVGDWATTPIPDLSGAGGDWNAFAYGNGIHVAVADSGTTRSMYSYDGLNWTLGSSDLDSIPWEDVLFAENIFVAVADGGNPRHVFSYDGVNWGSFYTLDASYAWRDLAHGDGTFVAVSGECQVAYSADGINWTIGADISSATCTDVAYGDGRFYVTAQAGTDASVRSYVSSDGGQTFANVTTPSAQGWRAVAYGNDKFVMVGDSPGEELMVYDFNTDTATNVSSIIPGGEAFRDVTYANGQFVAVSWIASTSPQIYVATGDPTVISNWSASSQPAAVDWDRISYAQGRFYGVDDATSGTGMMYASAGLGEDTPIVLFVDGASSSSAATTLTYGLNVDAGTTTIYADLWADTVIVKKDSGVRAVDLSDGNLYDGSLDPDVLFIATTSTTTLAADLLIASSTKVTAPANLVLGGDFYQGGVFLAEGSELYAPDSVQRMLSSSFDYRFDTSGDSNFPAGVLFSETGSKMFVLDKSGDAVDEYTLSTAWDIRTATYSQSTTTTNQETGPDAMAFGAAGTKLYVYGASSNSVNEYDLSVAWDVSTAAFLHATNTSWYATFMKDVEFSNDGTRMYMAESGGDRIAEFSLGAAWDVTTAVYAQEVNVFPEGDRPNGVDFSEDGTIMVVAGNVNEVVAFYRLGTAWDVSTAVAIGTIEADPTVSPYGMTGVTLGQNDTRLYVIGDAGETVNQFIIPTRDEYRLSGTFTGTSSLHALTVGEGATVTASTTLTLYRDLTVDGVFQMHDETLNLSPFGSLQVTGSPTGSINLGNVVVTDNTVYFLANASTTSLTIDPGTTLSSVTDSLITVAGDYTQNGTYTNDGGVIVLTGSSNTISGTGDLGALTVDGTYTFGVANATTAALTITSTGDLTAPTGVLRVEGDLTQGGTYDANGGSAVVALGGDFIQTGTYDANGGQLYLANGDFVQSGTFTANGGLVQLDSSRHNVEAASYVDQLDVLVGGSFVYDIDFNDDGTKLYVLGWNRVIEEWDLSVAYDVSTGSYVDTLDVSEAGTVSGMTFNNDGTKLYIVGPNSGDTVDEWDLSVAYDVSTATFVDDLYVGGRDTFPYDIVFNDDGTKLYTVGTQGSTVDEWDLSVAYDVSTGVYVDELSVGGNAPQPHSILFNGDGSKLYVLSNSSDTVDEWSLSTNYDVSSGTHTDELLVVGQESAPSGMVLNDDGTKLYIIGRGDHGVDEWDLSPAYDVSTGSYVDTLDIHPTDSPYGFTFNDDGAKVYTAGITHDVVTEWDLSVPYDMSTAAVVDALDVSAQNTLPRDVAFNDDGTKLYVLDGSVAAVDEWDLSVAYDVSTGVYVDTLVVTTRETSPYGISFNDDGTKLYIVGTGDDAVDEWDLSVAYDVSTGVYVDTLVVTTQEGNPTGITFNNDGSKVYVVGSFGDTVDEWDLSVAYDVSTGSYVREFSVKEFDNNPFDIAFNAEGTVLYVLGLDNDAFYEFSLGTSTTLSGTMTGSSAFYDLTQTGDLPVVFTDSASAFGTYTIASTSAVAGATTTIFGAGSTYTFQNVDWQGFDATSTVSLRSSASGTPWYLNVPASQINVEYVSVQDSDASTGPAIYATTSVDKGGNVNWSFDGSVPPPTPWNDTVWTLYDTITINATNIDEDLTDFPVYVDLSDLSSQFWSTTPAASTTVGTDIRVTTDDGSPVELPRELVLASSTAQTGELHFKADLISSTTDTAFRIYYNGSAAGDYEVTDTYGAQNVWTSAYAAVWHMSQDPSGTGPQLLDSTRYGNDGTSEGLMTSGDLVVSKMGYGIDFDGDNDAFDLGSITSTSSLYASGADVTMSALVDHDRTGDSYQRIFDKSDGTSASNGYMMSINSASTNGNLQAAINGQGTVNGSAIVPQDQWSVIAVSFDDAVDSAELVIDNTAYTSFYSFSIPSVTTDAHIGTWNHSTGREFNGIIDELRIATTTRSDAWAKAEYFNQSTTTDFYATSSFSATVTLADHADGQATNQFNFQNKTDEVLFTFQLTPDFGGVTTTMLRIDLSGAHDVSVSNFSNLRLVRDDTVNGVFDSGSDTVLGTGVMTANGQLGAVTFTTPFLVSGPQNYLLVADWSAPDKGAQLNFDLYPAGVSLSNTTFVTGSVSGVQHSRTKSRGGGGSSAQVGGAAPAGDGDVGGGTNDGGELIGDEADFYWPAGSSDDWTSAANAYDQTDGTYATNINGTDHGYKDFTFGVPGTDQITGIEVKMEISGTVGGGNIGVELSWDDAVSRTVTGYTTPVLTTTDTVVTLGGPTDLWGRSGWTVSEVNPVNFFVILSSTEATGVAQIDEIQVNVYHQAGGGGSGGGGAI